MAFDSFVWKLEPNCQIGTSGTLCGRCHRHIIRIALRAVEDICMGSPHGVKRDLERVRLPKPSGALGIYSRRTYLKRPQRNQPGRKWLDRISRQLHVIDRPEHASRILLSDHGMHSATMPFHLSKPLHQLRFGKNASMPHIASFGAHWWHCTGRPQVAMFESWSRQTENVPCNACY